MFCMGFVGVGTWSLVPSCDMPKQRPPKTHACGCSPQTTAPPAAWPEISIELSWEEVKPEIQKYFDFKEEDLPRGVFVKDRVVNGIGTRGFLNGAKENGEEGKSGHFLDELPKAVDSVDVFVYLSFES